MRYVLFTISLLLIVTLPAVAWNNNQGALQTGEAPTAHQASHRIGGGDALPAATSSLAGLLGLNTSGGTTATKAVTGDDARLAQASASNRGTVALNTSGGTTATMAVIGSDARLAQASSSNRGTVALNTSGGTTATMAVIGSDSRLSNARTPSAHQGSHRIGAVDALPAASTTTCGIVGLNSSSGTTASMAIAGNDTRIARVAQMRNGMAAWASGATTCTVTFGGAVPNALYTPVFSLLGASGSMPSTPSIDLTSITTTGFNIHALVGPTADISASYMTMP